MNLWEFLLDDRYVDQRSGQLFWVTDPWTLDGEIVSPMVWEWRKALLDAQIWYYEFMLELRRILKNSA